MLAFPPLTTVFQALQKPQKAEMAVTQQDSPNVLKSFKFTKYTEEKHILNTLLTMKVEVIRRKNRVHQPAFYATISKSIQSATGELHSPFRPSPWISQITIVPVLGHVFFLES